MWGSAEGESEIAEDVARHCWVNAAMSRVVAFAIAPSVVPQRIRREMMIGYCCRASNGCTVLGGLVLRCCQHP